MATVEEVYAPYGIIHSDKCSVCEVATSERKLPKFKITRVTVKWIDRILIGTLLLGGGMLIGMWLTWQPVDPLERVYKEYNHIRIYEDGSYEGEKHGEFSKDTGCIIGAPCQD